MGVNTASAANGTTDIPILDWFITNFVFVFIILTILSLLLILFFIYRRHRKYGLGPRIVSILYIDGFNLKSIGNTLCIIGIIIVIISLVHPWYVVSYTSQINYDIETDIEVPTEGNLIYLDGIDGLKATIPGSTEPLPIGSMPIPFSLIIGISILFLILATVGIPLSKKLGSKYILYGIKLFIPVIFIIVGIMLLGAIASNFSGGVSEYYDIRSVIDSISSSPFGGSTAVPVSGTGAEGVINLRWGVGLGAWLLLFAGIVILVAGILEKFAKIQFFTTKIPLPGQAPSIMPAYQVPIPQQQPPTSQPSAPQKQAPPPKTKFCMECGAKLKATNIFCTKCGKKQR
jgi:hypothetical protein